MTTKLFKSLTLIAVLLAASTAHAETTNCTAITNLPFVIDKQGVYCLIRNLSYDLSVSSAISVNTNNVIIDLNGFTLVGLAGGPATTARGIYALNRQNITIRNGAIRGFQKGIFLNDSSASLTVSQRHLIEDIRASKNILEGFYLVGSDIIVRRNQVVDTGGTSSNTTGIFIQGPSARVLNNDISRTKAMEGHFSSGLQIASSRGAVVENNRIDNFRKGPGIKYGLRIWGCRNLLAVGNRISTAQIGIHYLTDSTGKYMNNLTSNVDEPYKGGTDVVGTNY